MKKIIGAIFSILLSVLLCSCDPIKNAEEIIENVKTMNASYSELSDDAEKITSEAFEALSNRDSNSLYELFCSENKKEKLTEEIDTLFNSVEGNILSSGEKNQYHMSIHFVNTTTEYSVERFRLDDIVTDSNKTYWIMFYVGISYDEKNDNVGLQSIVLYEGKKPDDNNKRLCQAGRYIESYAEQSMPESCAELNSRSLIFEEEYTKNLLYYLQEKDKKSFVSLFAENQKGLAEKYFDDIIELIDGKMKTYSTILADTTSSYFNYDHYEMLCGTAGAYDILNDSGKKFEIEYKAYYVNLETPSEEGICSFSFRLVENDINDDLEHNIIKEIKIPENDHN